NVWRATRDSGLLRPRMRETEYSFKLQLPSGSRFAVNDASASRLPWRSTAQLVDEIPRHSRTTPDRSTGVPSDQSVVLSRSETMPRSDNANVFSRNRLAGYNVAHRVYRTPERTGRLLAGHARIVGFAKRTPRRPHSLNKIG